MWKYSRKRKERRPSVLCWERQLVFVVAFPGSLWDWNDLMYVKHLARHLGQSNLLRNAEYSLEWERVHGAEIIWELVLWTRWSLKWPSDLWCHDGQCLHEPHICHPNPHIVSLQPLLPSLALSMAFPCMCIAYENIYVCIYLHVSVHKWDMFIWIYCIEPDDSHNWSTSMFVYWNICELLYMFACINYIHKYIYIVRWIFVFLYLDTRTCILIKFDHPGWFECRDEQKL